MDDGAVQVGRGAHLNRDVLEAVCFAKAEKRGCNIKRSLAYSSEKIILKLPSSSMSSSEEMRAGSSMAANTRLVASLPLIMANSDAGSHSFLQRRANNFLHFFFIERSETWNYAQVFLGISENMRIFAFQCTFFTIRI